MMKFKKALKIFGLLVLSFFLLIGGGVAYLTLDEYKPDKVENIEYADKNLPKLLRGEELSILTWNIGYCALGEKSDFFMDGGKMVRGFSKEDVKENLGGILADVKRMNPDMILFQEVDRKGYRSYHVNQVDEIKKGLNEMEGGFAVNFKCSFVPYPFPPIRDVDAGILSLGRHSTNSIQRISLPVPFEWPVRVVNLKRCLLVSRFPVEGSEKEFVLVNLHLEAYDDGEGKIAQTEALMKLLKEEKEKGNYVIAGGDFNQSFSHINIGDFENYPEGRWKPGKIETEKYREDFEFLMDEKVPTCRSLDRPYEAGNKDFSHYFIDGFIVSKNVEIEEVKTIDLGFKNTDHNPVNLKIRLK